MCFGGSAKAPTSPAPYALDQSHTAVTQEAKPVSADTQTTEQITPGKTTADTTVGSSVAGGSGLDLRM